MGEDRKKGGEGGGGKLAFHYILIQNQTNKEYKQHGYELRFHRGKPVSINCKYL